MNVVTEFLAILFGVVMSIIFPLVWKWVVLPTDTKRNGIGDYLNSVYKPYILAGIASIVISLFILMFATDLTNWQGAAMLGFGWQAFVKNLQSQG